MKKLSELSISDLVALRNVINEDYIKNKSIYSPRLTEEVEQKIKFVTHELQKRLFYIDFEN